MEERELFIKFNSLENYYVNHFIYKAIEFNPSILNDTYIITEKLHGSNFQMIFTKDEVKYASRRGLLEDSDKFYGYKAVVNSPYTMSFKDKISTLIGENFNDEEIEQVNVYGELFGGGIQKGVDYGAGKQFKMFLKLKINGVFITVRETFKIMLRLFGSDFMKLLVPIVAYTSSLDEALEYDTKFNSLIFSNNEDNICEGIVIENYDRNVFSPNGSAFIIKKKNKEFEEKASKSKRVKKEQKKVAPELTQARDEFELYLVENRVKGMFSKEGMITTHGEIGKYIKLIVEDAKVDFLKDNEELYLAVGKPDRKNIFSTAGKIISTILVQYL